MRLKAVTKWQAICAIPFGAVLGYVLAAVFTSEPPWRAGVTLGLIFLSVPVRYFIERRQVKDWKDHP